jgi:hypothetical protein
MSKKMMSILLSLLFTCLASSVSVSLDMPFKYPCIAHAFFPERLSNHAQGLRRILSKICTKIGAHSLSDPSRYRIRPDPRLQIKGCKKSARPPNCVTFYTLTQDLLVLSSIIASHYYNCCTDGSTSSGNYGLPLICQTSGNE